MKKLILILAVVLITAVGCTTQPTSTPTAVAPTSTPTFVPPTPAYTVQEIKDIDYTMPLQPDVPAQKLDVYAPAEPGPWPVVVLLHSSISNKDVLEYTSLGKDLAGRGAVVFVPNWRAYTSLEVTQNDGRLVREASEELTCAVRFARARATDYGGDPGWVTLVGHSEAAGMRKLWSETTQRCGMRSLRAGEVFRHRWTVW
jgi:acetyl esterase/lipase